MPAQPPADRPGVNEGAGRSRGRPRTRSRGIGWEFVHVAVGATRLSHVEVLPDASSARWFGGWADGAIYGDSDEQRCALGGWLDFDNRRRPHRSLGRQPPVERLQALTNNVAGSY